MACNSIGSSIETVESQSLKSRSTASLPAYRPKRESDMAVVSAHESLGRMKEWRPV